MPMKTAFQDEWSLMTESTQDRFYCKRYPGEYFVNTQEHFLKDRTKNREQSTIHIHSYSCLNKN